MAKKVFFSFHYQDVIDFRANVVRNHGKFKIDKDEAGYYDSSIWEKVKKGGDIALKRLINGKLKYTSNTCVLVGSETYKRKWVRYEILKSFLKGNYIFAVHINKIKDKYEKTKPYGNNPLDYVGIYPINENEFKLCEYKNNKWIEYKNIENKSTFQWKNHGLDINKVYQLSKFYLIYCWVKDDGYNNFKEWVK